MKVHLLRETSYEDNEVINESVLSVWSTRELAEKEIDRRCTQCYAKKDNFEIEEYILDEDINLEIKSWFLKPLYYIIYVIKKKL